MTQHRTFAMPAPPIAEPARVFGSALIVDDHPLFCDALSMTLRAVAGVGRTETADSLAAALDRLDAGLQPDLVVLDLNLPDVSGLDGLVRLRSAVAPAPVVVVSSVDDRRMIVAAIRAGAAGFVPKHSHQDVFRRAFAAIALGEAWLPEGLSLADDAPAGGREEVTRRLGQLTRQQGRILELICEGKLNKQIAFDLSIADATVKAHVTAIMRKLGVQTRTQAVLLAREVSFSAILHD